MAGILSLSGRRQEPMPRIWHTSWQAGSKVLVQGGLTHDPSEKNKRHLSSIVDSFDLYTELWQPKEVTGEAPPLGVYAAASVIVNDDLFAFGGYDGSEHCNTLHRSKDGSQWVELCPQSKSLKSPMAKATAGMVAFSGNLALFGGYGKPHGPTQPGSSFIKKANSTVGWTNEFHIYNLKDGMYRLKGGRTWIRCGCKGMRRSGLRG